MITNSINTKYKYNILLMSLTKVYEITTIIIIKLNLINILQKYYKYRN